jgi:aspartate beta-hydroxylase
LRIGLASQEPGTKDSKFLYHYGDALTRLGRKKEADDMFEKAAQDKVFLSKFQRSTYNIDRLTGRPWWEKDDFNITVRNYIRKLEADWEIIRDEGMYRKCHVNFNHCTVADECFVLYRDIG